MPRPMTPARVGKAIWVMRQLAGLSQAELAARSRLTAGTIGDIETGKRSMNLTTLDQVMNGLNLDWDITFIPREAAQE